MLKLHAWFLTKCNGNTDVRVDLNHLIPCASDQGCFASITFPRNFKCGKSADVDGGMRVEQRDWKNLLKKCNEKNVFGALMVPPHSSPTHSL